MAIHLYLITPGLYLVCSNNAGVVAVINKSRSWSACTNNVLREIYRLQLNLHIHLKTMHVSGRDNIADALSCGNITSFLKGFPQATSKVTFLLPPHLAGLLLLY